MTRQDFVERWKRHVTGIIAAGTSKCRVGDKTQLTFEGAAALGTVMIEVHDEAVKLLGQLYDSIEPKVPLNGAATQRTKV